MTADRTLPDLTQIATPPGDTTPYDHRNLQSLFGYGRRVHAASGGICQLCGYGAGVTADPDLWRQLTVEHLIGEKQGGHLGRVRTALGRRFPQLRTAELRELAVRVEVANMVSACHFCNSMTSREVAPTTMEAVIESAAGDTPDEMLMAIAARLQPILDGKRQRVRRKLDVVTKAFHAEIAEELNAARADLGRAAQPPGPDVADAAEHEAQRHPMPGD